MGDLCRCASRKSRFTPERLNVLLGIFVFMPLPFAYLGIPCATNYGLTLWGLSCLIFSLASAFGRFTSGNYRAVSLHVAMVGNEIGGGIISYFWCGPDWAWRILFVFESIFVICAIDLILGWVHFWHLLHVSFAMLVFPFLWTFEDFTQGEYQRLADDSDSWSIRILIICITFVIGSLGLGYVDRRSLRCQKYHEPQAQSPVCASPNKIFSVVPDAPIPSLRQGDEANCTTNPCEMDEAQPAQNIMGVPSLRQGDEATCITNPCEMDQAQPAQNIMGDSILPHVVQLGDQALGISVTTARLEERMISSCAHEIGQFGAYETSDSLSLSSDKTRDTVPPSRTDVKNQLLAYYIFSRYALGRGMNTNVLLNALDFLGCKWDQPVAPRDTFEVLPEISGSMSISSSEPSVPSYYAASEGSVTNLWYKLKHFFRVG